MLRRIRKAVNRTPKADRPGTTKQQPQVPPQGTTARRQAYHPADDPNVGACTTAQASALPLSEKATTTSLPDSNSGDSQTATISRLGHASILTLPAVNTLACSPESFDPSATSPSDQTDMGGSSSRNDKTPETPPPPDEPELTGQCYLQFSC